MKYFNMSKSILLICLMFISTYKVKSQAQIVLNNDVFLVQDGGTNARPIYVVVTNSSDNSVLTSGSGGNWISENEYNKLRWHIDASTGSYRIPYSTGTSVKIPFQMQITGAGTPSLLNAYIDFSTFPTIPMNTPYPSMVNNMLDANTLSFDNSLSVIDRFWIIDGLSAYSNAPASNLNFGYNPAETANPNNITVGNMVAQVFNSTTDEWFGQFGVDNAGITTVENAVVASNELFQAWTLVIDCIPPEAPTNVLASEPIICAGDVSIITASGPSDPNVTYNVYSAATGGTNLGATPFNASPTTTTSYWVEAVSISNSNCVSITRTEVVISVDPQPTASNAGNNETICANSHILNANNAAIGNGVWTVISGTGIVTDNTSNNSNVTNLSNGANVFEWTISSGVCPPSSSQVTINVEETPTLSDAGTTQVICNTSTELEGNTPVVGTGSWSVISGSGAFVDNSNPNTTVNGLSIGDNVFEWTISNGSCPSSSTQVIITNTGGPSINLIESNDVSCNGLSDGSIQVEGVGGAPGYTYSWIPASGNSPSLNNLQPGSYTVTVLDDAGCTDELTITIQEPDAISITINTTQTSCGTSDGTASANVTGGDNNYTYSWSPIGGNAAIASDLSAGTYTVTVTDGNNCQQTESATIGVLDGPVITIESTTDASCFGNNDGTAEISVTGGNGSYTYLWSPTGDQTSSVENLPAGSYTVLVTDDAGCEANETIIIGVPSQISIIPSVSNADCGNDNGLISVTATGGDGNYIYSWSNGQTNSSINNLSPGSYTVNVTDGNGCIATETITVVTQGNLTVTVNPSLASIEAGETVQLEASGGTTYSWSPPDGLSCTDCANPIASPVETTLYTVVATDSYGCQGDTTVLVVVQSDCADIFVPTMFSPNSDGSNDLHCVYGSCIQSMTMKIYNRWGELVFSSDKQSQCWDGTHRGKLVNSGVFVYVLNYTLTNGTEVKDSGNLNVVR